MPPPIPRRSVDALRGALVLGMACAVDGPLRFVAGLPLVAAALVFAVRAWVTDESERMPEPPGSLWPLVAAASALGVISRSTGGSMWFEVLWRAFAACGVVLVGLVSSDEARWRRRGLAMAVIGATVIYAITPAAVPHPQIDVVSWTSTAIRALLDGIHPYTVPSPDVYNGGRDFGFVVTVYPYMPATLLVFAPVTAAFGDFRYALAACLPATIWLVRSAARRGGVDRRLADAATLAIVLNPVGVQIVRSGWSEPLLTVVAAAFALAAVRRRHAVSAVSVLMLPVLKQYALAPALLWAATGDRRAHWRAWLTGGLLGLATLAPFLLWDASATLQGVLFQMRAPTHPRLVSMSIPGLLASAGLPYPPIWTSVVAQLAVASGAAAFGLVASTGAVFVASAVALLVTFLLGWQGFVNYYAFIASLLAIATVVAASRTEAA